MPLFNLRTSRDYADKCAELRRLNPSRREFAARVRSRVDEVMQDRVPPMRFETLKRWNPDLYRRLYSSGGV